MNKHLETMKNLMRNYDSSVTKAHAKIAENNKLFQPEEAERQNNAILERLKADKEAVKAQILEAREKGAGEFEAWGKLDGGQITPDAKLLEHGTITPDQFKALADRYQGNATMVDLLLKYANEHGSNGGGGFTAAWNFSGKEKQDKPHYDTSGLHTSADKIATLDRCTNEALGFIESFGDTSRLSTEGWRAARIDRFGEGADI